MSYHVFFEFSQGLSRPIKAKPGTLEKILTHVRHVEKTLGYKTSQYMDNPPHWESTVPIDGVTDKVFCKTAEDHNIFVRWLYDRLAEWSEKPPNPSEEITPEDAKQFWHGLRLIEVPWQRWTRDYYVARMQCLYEVMRGNDCEGISFDEKALTPEQCSAVMNLFSQYLDTHDSRLAVPRGCDYLAASDDGGYEWCEKCGAVTYDDAMNCEEKDCELRKELEDESL